MIYTHHYESPLGGITIAADGEGITGLAFDGQKFFSEDIPADAISFPTNPEASLDGPMPDQESAGRIREYFHQADAWLDTYFSGRDPGFTPPLHLKVTDFRKEVCDIMLTIPFGKTMTYGQIAGILARRIVSYVTLDDKLRQGELYGMIKFGSCLEVVMPQDVAVTVKKGQKVTGGKTIIGRMKD